MQITDESKRVRTVIKEWFDAQQQIASLQRQLLQAQERLQAKEKLLGETLVPKAAPDNVPFYVWVNTEGFGFLENERLLSVERTSLGCKVEWWRPPLKNSDSPSESDKR